MTSNIKGLENKLEYIYTNIYYIYKNGVKTQKDRDLLNSFDFEIYKIQKEHGFENNEIIDLTMYFYNILETEFDVEEDKLDIQLEDYNNKLCLNIIKDKEIIVENEKEIKYYTKIRTLELEL